MKTNNMINCMYDGLKAVQVVFRNSAKQYTYKTFDDYKIGDKCVVDSPSEGYVVVEVVGTDQTKLEENHRYKFVVQKIDDSKYIELNEREEIAVQKLSAAIRQKSIDEQRKKVLELVGSEQQLIEVKQALKSE